MNKPEVTRAQLERFIGRLFDEIQDTKRSVASIQRAQDTKHTVLLPGESIKQLGEDGRVVAEIGGNSGAVVKHVDGPDPAQPEAPEVEVQEGQLTVIVDGYDVDGEAAPEDLARTIVHYSREDGFVAYQGTSKGTITGASGQKVFGPSAGTWFVRVQWETLSGKLSEPSEQVEVDVAPPVSVEDMEATLATAEQIISDAMAEAQTQFDALQERLDNFEDFDPTDLQAELAAVTQGLADARDEANGLIADLGERVDGIKIPDVSGFITQTEVDAAAAAAETAAKEHADLVAQGAEDNAIAEAEAKADAARAAAEQTARDYADAQDIETLQTAAQDATAKADAAQSAAEAEADRLAKAEAKAAESAAIAAAAADALIQAEAARDAAIASASTDATAKADAAREAAETAAAADATAKTEAAEARAAKDATDKAAAVQEAAQTEAERLAGLAQTAAETAAAADATLKMEAAEARAATEAARIARAEAEEKADAAETAAKAYADLKAAGEGGDALAAAKEYADAQAEAARIAAEAAAALDATAKMEQAEAEAAKDAKAKADQALVDAKADATAKANTAERLAKEAAALDATAKAEAAEAEAARLAALDATAKADAARQAAEAAASTDATTKSDAAREAAEAEAARLAGLAEEAAKTAAAADAKAKADAAQAEAIRQAALDATAKADAAKTAAENAAKDYADQQDATVKAEAAADAQTKADAAIATAQEALDNLEIGSRNLLTGTSDKPVTDHRPAGSHYREFRTDAPLEVGQTYTFSIIVEKLSEDDAPVSVDLGSRRIDSGFSRDITGGRDVEFGQKHVMTFTPTASQLADGRDFLAWRLRNRQIETTVSYREVKLEKGTKATDWSPAPEDLQAVIDAAQARADEAHANAGTAWTHADAAMTRAGEAETNAIEEAGRLATAAREAAEAEADRLAKAEAQAAQSAAEANAAADALAKANAARDAAIDSASDDATAKANAAKTAAETAAATDAKAKADAAQAEAIRQAALDATAKANAAKTAAENAAKQHADNLPKMLGGTGAPSGTAPNGSVWFRRDSSNTVIGRWERIGNAWVQQEVSGELIDNLEAGKITALYTEFAESVVGKLWVQLAVIERLVATSAWIGGAMIGNDAVEAKHVVASETLSGKVAEFLKLSVADLVAGTADIDDAVVNKFWAALAVIERLRAAEAWVTGDLVVGETIHTRHLRVTKDMVGEFAKFLHLVVDQMDANRLWADQTWQREAFFGSEDADQQTRVDGTGITLYRKVDGEFIPAAIFGGGDIHLSFFDDDNESTGTITRDGNVSGINADFQNYTIQGHQLTGDLEQYQHDMPILETLPKAFTGYNYRIMHETNGANEHQYGFLPVEFHAVAGITYEVMVSSFRLRFVDRQAVNAYVHYTTDGSTPTLASPVIEGGINGGQEAVERYFGNDRNLIVPEFTRFFHAEHTGLVRLLLSIEANDTAPTLWWHNGNRIEIRVRPAGVTPIAAGGIREATSSNPDLRDGTVNYWNAWAPTWHQNYRDGEPYHQNNKYMHQGALADGRGFTAHVGGYRTTPSMWGDAGNGLTINQALAGATLTRGTLTLTGVANATSTGGSARVHWHAHTSAPSTFPLTPSPGNIVGVIVVRAGQQSILQLPQSCLDAIAAGTFQGFSFHPRGSDHPYISLAGSGASSTVKPILRLGYTR